MNMNHYSCFRYCNRGGDKDRENTERKNIADILIAKHRNGPIGKIELFFNESQVSFKSLEKYMDSPAG